LLSVLNVSPVGSTTATLCSVLVSPCALRVRGVLAVLTASSVDPSVRSGLCNSNSNNDCNRRDYSNVSDQNSINDTSSASTGNHRYYYGTTLYGP
jgi:hypothetical protein